MKFFNSLGHFFASVFSNVAKALPGIQKDITTVEASATVVEGVTAAIPVYGPLGVTLEEAGYAVLGEVAAVLTAGGAAAAASLANVGLDTKVIQTVQALVTSIPNLVPAAASAAKPVAAAA